MILTFQMYYNDVVEEMSEGMLGDISFEYIFLTDCAIGSIHSSTLLPSSERLLSLSVDGLLNGGKLTEFPWDALHQFTSLYNVNIQFNSITTLPQFESSSLMHLNISNLIRAAFIALSREWADAKKHISAKSRGWNPITDIPAGFFRDMGNLERFDCYDCALGPTLSTKYLEFHSLQPDTGLSISTNEIRELTEVSFCPMLEVLSLGTGSINLNGEIFLDHNAP
ncbi:unnamed protein product [Darwinula stevensoni]|uniref:Uncharacterized protein n=1 Tax=Darwinula stevensoni TaxID=69355 RepID=A0A7R9AAQ0_9CRUS|nr:unnamed protein product [Darwinula stevensoni]CAG0898225.1 unnamed protein product [Darwinula stevensoni]